MMKLLPSTYNKCLLVGLLTLFSIGSSTINAQSFSGSKVVNASNGMTINVTAYPVGDSVQVTLTGPSNVWFAFGFGSSFMANTYCILTDGTGNISERKLGNHNGGSLLPSSFTRSSQSNNSGTRTTMVTRTLSGLNSNYFTFPGSASTITLIWAFGNSSSFGSHFGRGATTIVLTKNCKNVVDVSVTQNGAQLSANNSGASYRWIDCSNGNVVISGETNQSFSPVMNGSYAVEISEAGCTDTSACFSINTIGLSETDFAANITTYPSPTKGEVTLSLGSVYLNFTVAIYDHTGKLVSENSFKKANKVMLNLQGATGLYFAHITTDDGKTATVKIFKS